MVQNKIFDKCQRRTKKVHKMIMVSILSSGERPKKVILCVRCHRITFIIAVGKRKKLSVITQVEEYKSLDSRK